MGYGAELREAMRPMSLQSWGPPNARSAAVTKNTAVQKVRTKKHRMVVWPLGSFAVLTNGEVSDRSWRCIPTQGAMELTKVLRIKRTMLGNPFIGIGEGYEPCVLHDGSLVHDPYSPLTGLLGPAA